MKKFLLALLLLAAVGAVNADAENRLVFERADGGQQSFALTELSMTVNDGKLYITNSEGSATLDVAGLSKMFFSDEFSTISNLTADALNGPATVYSLTGIRTGHFTTMREACKALSAGYYIIESNGVTYKIRIQ